MATVSFTLTPALVAELNLIAQSEGFPDAKAMNRHWLRAKVKAYRSNKAGTDARKTAEAQADLDAEAIV